MMVKRIGYLVFGLVSFLFFFWLLSPRNETSVFDPLLPYLTQKIEAQLSPDRSIKLEAESLGPYWPPGITFRNVKVKNSNSVLFTADSVAMRLRLLPLLTGKRSIGYKIKAYGGKISGT